MQEKAVHLGLKPYNCKQCPFEASSSKIMQEHVLKDHGKMKREPILKIERLTHEVAAKWLPLCDIKDLFREKYLAETSQFFELKPYNCKQCPFEASSSKIMQEHVLKDHEILKRKPILKIKRLTHEMAAKWLPLCDIKNLFREKSFAETNHFFEPFRVYIQALISQCLESTFLHDVLQDKVDYFVSNIDKVDSVTLLQKDRVIKGISWSVKFQCSLDTWPFLKKLETMVAYKEKCDKDCPIATIFLNGQPYDSTILKEVAPSEEAVKNKSFSVCAKCNQLGKLYHNLKHHKYKLFQKTKTLVWEKQKMGGKELTDVNILSELLANDIWLEKQFRKLQYLWADTH